MEAYLLLNSSNVFVNSSNQIVLHFCHDLVQNGILRIRNYLLTISTAQLFFSQCISAVRQFIMNDLISKNIEIAEDFFGAIPCSRICSDGTFQGFLLSTSTSNQFFITFGPGNNSQSRKVCYISSVGMHAYS